MPTTWKRAAAAAGVLLVSGCTIVHQGSAIKDPHDDPNAANVALLDHGSYPTRPSAPLGTAATDLGGSNLEAARMATNVTLPNEVSPELTEPWPTFTTVLDDADALRVILADPIADAAAANHYITGFSTERSGQIGTAPARILGNAVFRFATPQDAAAAATAMAAAPDATAVRATSPARSIPIPRYPGAVAFVYGVDGGFDVTAYTPHGAYVLYQFAGSKATPEAAADLVADALDAQGPLIDAFAPTPLEQLGALPRDPTGLLARTVPDKDATVNELAVYSPHAALHFEPDLAAAQQMYNALGVDAVAVNRTWVYQTKDAGAATQGRDQLLKTTVNDPAGYAPMPGIPGLPGARCYDHGTAHPDTAATRYLCVATAGRYLFKATAAQDIDARQIIAAQYLILTAPR
jgi:hypothetical protein